MSSPGPSDEDDAWHAATDIAHRLPSDRTLAASTRSSLAVLIAGIVLLAATTAIVVWSPAALNPGAVSEALVLVSLLILALGVGVLAYRAFRLRSSRRMYDVLTPDQRRRIRAEIGGHAEVGADNRFVLIGYLRQRRQVIATAGAMGGCFLAFLAQQIAVHRTSSFLVVLTCLSIAFLILIGIGSAQYRRYGKALRREQSKTVIHSSEP